MLGWSALSDVAKSDALVDGGFANESSTLQPTRVAASDLPVQADLSGQTLKAMQHEAEVLMKDETVTRQVLESKLVQFQLSFLGGYGMELEACSTGGGTRSINLAFESVLTSRRLQGLDTPPGGFKVNNVGFFWHCSSVWRMMH